MKIKNEAAVALGKLSHSRQSKDQSAASRLNGMLGGRPRTKSFDLPARSITEVNRVIKDMKIELVRGDGYFYFVSKNPDIGPVGESIMLCYVNQQSLCNWRTCAKQAIKGHSQLDY